MEGKKFKSEIVVEDLDAVIGMSEEDTFSQVSLRDIVSIKHKHKVCEEKMITMTKNEVNTNIFFVLSNNTCIKASESV